MSNVLESMYDLLTKPKTALTDIADNQTVFRAFQIVLLSTILSTLGIYAELFDGSAKVFIISLQICSSIFIWGVSVAVWHLLAELLGAKGSVKSLLTTVGFIYFLQILLVPVYLVATFVPSAGVALISIATFAVMVWSVVLEIYAIRAVYQVSGAKAALILFLPAVILIGFIVAIGIMASAFFMSIFSEVMANPPQF